MTLFDAVTTGDVFGRVLDRYFDGDRDHRTRTPQPTSKVDPHVTARRSVGRASTFRPDRVVAFDSHSRSAPLTAGDAPLVGIEAAWSMNLSSRAEGSWRSHSCDKHLSRMDGSYGRGDILELQVVTRAM